MRGSAESQLDGHDGGGAAPRRPRPFEVGHAEVWRITLPMTAAFLTTPLLGLTDTAVVGRVGDAVALGGLTVGAIIFDFAFSTFNFLRSGTTGLTAQALGAGEEREIQAVFWRSCLIATVIGILLILAQPLLLALGLFAIAPGEGVAEATGTYVFIRMFSAPFALLNYAILGHVLGTGRAMLGLALQALINGTNVAVSVWLGLLLEGGIAGVAMGTVIAEAFGVLVGLLILVPRFDRAERPSRRRIFDATGFRRMIAVNRDIMIRSFCLLTAFMLFARLGAQFGTVTLAANGILLNFFLVGGFFLDGVATAAEQLVGRAIGARWLPAFDRTIRLTGFWSLVLAAALSAAFYVTGAILIAALTTDLAVRQAAGTFLIWAALTPLAGALAFHMDGVYIGATWSRTMRDMMLLSLVLFVAAAMVLGPLFGNHGLWLALDLFLCLRGFSLLAALPARRRETFGSRQLATS